jgi:hypothetical protein
MVFTSWTKFPFKKVQVQPTHPGGGGRYTAALSHTTLCRVGENEERILVTQKRENSSNTSFHTFGEFAVDTAHLAHGAAKGAERLLAHLYFPISVEEMRAKLIALGLLKILPTVLYRKRMQTEFGGRAVSGWEIQGLAHVHNSLVHGHLRSFM